ncbi:MAG: aldehyde dehydrogenase family protein, partial [Bacillota bacterium]
VDPVLNGISFGGGCINDTVAHIASPYLPFGGVGESGMGKYHGKASFEIFSNQKGILNKSNLFDLPFRYPTHRKQLNLVKSLLK